MQGRRLLRPIHEDMPMVWRGMTGRSKRRPYAIPEKSKSRNSMAITMPSSRPLTAG